MAKEKCGWDITAYVDQGERSLLLERHIEVKPRAKGQSSITVSRSEISYGLNQKEKFILVIVIVIVDGEAYEGSYSV